MQHNEKATATAATVHRGGMGKNHRYYTALQEETQAAEIDFGLDTYATPRTIKKESRDDRERTWMKYEL